MKTRRYAEREEIAAALKEHIDDLGWWDESGKVLANVFAFLDAKRFRVKPAELLPRRDGQASRVMIFLTDLHEYERWRQGRPEPLVAGRDYEATVCDNCGKDVHTPSELAACIDSILAPQTRFVIKEAENGWVVVDTADGDRIMDDGPVSKRTALALAAEYEECGT